MAHSFLVECKAAGNISDLNTAIYLLRSAAYSWLPSAPQLPKCLHRLSMALVTRFSYTAEQQDIVTAVALAANRGNIRRLISEMDSCSENPQDMLSFAESILTDFHRAVDLGILETAVTLHREALDLQLESHYSGKWRLLWELSEALLMQYRLTNDMAHLNDAISCLREVQQLQPNRSVCLAAALITGDYRKVQLSHILEADRIMIQGVQKSGEALDLLVHSHEPYEAFKKSGNILDRDSMIAELQRAEFLLSWGHGKHRGIVLHLLGTMLWKRAKKHGDEAEVDKAVELLTEAVALHIYPPPYPERHGFLKSLAEALETKFIQRRNAKDIDHAIQVYREALTCRTPCACSLSDVAHALYTRFQHSGNSIDIDEAVELCAVALGLCGPPHLDRADCLDKLANALRSRYVQCGSSKDIDDAVKLHREALTLRTSIDPQHACSVNNLANSLQARFWERKDPKDLDESVELHREAITLHGLSHPDFIHSLNNLAIVLENRFERYYDARDLNEAIKLHQKALALCGPSHPDRHIYLNNLAVALFTKFQSDSELCSDIEDINKAIELNREALTFRMPSHPRHSSSLLNLGNAIQAKSQWHGNSQDIPQVIQLYRAALDLCPSPHPSRGSILQLLARALASEGTLLDDSISAFEEASKYVSSSPLTQFQATSEWADVAAQHGHISALAAYSMAIDLLPQVAAFHLDLASRHHVLTTQQIRTLASRAATCAIKQGQHHLGVEFLEASRSIFWAQALHLRSSLEELHKVDPNLAQYLKELSTELESSSFRNSVRTISTGNQQEAMSIEAEGAHCRQLNEKWVEMMQSVRRLHGFKDFMKPRRIATLQKAASKGPIVILVARKSHCFALVLLHSDVRSVQLPEITEEGIAARAELMQALSKPSFNGYNFLVNAKKGSERISTHSSTQQARLYGHREDCSTPSSNSLFRGLLADLWNTVVKPVFDALNYEKSTTPPRLWWCPTGLFTFLPLHAAGIYGRDGTECPCHAAMMDKPACVADYIVPSYAPTVAALLDSDANAQTTAAFKMTAVIEPNAPNCIALPGTTDELTNIIHRVPAQWLTILLDTTGAEVKQHLEDSCIMHFACHGVQDMESPIDSGLMLSDGCLKVSQIMQRAESHDHMEENSNRTSLAFMSACETAKGDKNAPDEAMHLAASLLFTGFHGVVATMWSIQDQDGPRISDTFYEHLFKGCDPNSDPPIVPDLKNAAEALHIAVAKLREDPTIPFARWVPFIHYGL